MPSWLSLSFQDSASPSMGELSSLHDHVMAIMFSVIVLIMYIMCYLLLNLKSYKFLSEGTFIETIWSLIPALLLVILVLPSMKVLYMVEDIKFPQHTFKIIAHQWYWTYVSPLVGNLSFSLGGNSYDSYEFDSLLDPSLPSVNFPRLLGCSSDFFMPLGCTSRLLITSSDVIHSFASPSIGLKVDALPGRINQLFCNPSRLGLFYGQCSEICGSNHSFMPISIKICNTEDFDAVGKSYLMTILSEGFSVSTFNL